MSEYTFRFANANDAEPIMNFIGLHWKSDHILARHKTFFNYEFLYDEQLNFAVSENDKKEIIAIEGFIKYTQSYENADIALVMWKAIKGVGDPFLGVKLLNFITASGFRTISSCGINQQTAPIYQYLGYRTGELLHYYQINPKINNFNIATIHLNKHTATRIWGDASLLKIHCYNEFEKYCDAIALKSRKPFKDKWYLNKRYFNHPVYQYDIFAISNNSGIESIIVGREITIANSKVFRIVDFIGNDDSLRYVGHRLRELMIQNEYEYIDFYQVGIADDVMKEAGFILRTTDDSNIIPNYFEPFEKRNVPILYFTNTNDKIYLFKGDGDQDRPNFLNRDI